MNIREVAVLLAASFPMVASAQDTSSPPTPADGGITSGQEAAPMFEDDWILPPVSETSDAPGSKLLNFENPKLVEGSFVVIFKKPDELLKIQKGTMQVLDGVLPISDADIERVAHALTEKAGGKLVEILNLDKLGEKGFAVENMPVEAAKALIDDPRVERVEAEPIGELHGLQDGGDLVTILSPAGRRGAWVELEVSNVSKVP